MYAKVETPSQALELAIQSVINGGTISSPRGQSTLEIHNATIVMEKPWLVPFEVQGRKFRDFIGAVEALQLVGQTVSSEIVTTGSKAFKRFTDGGIFHGAYGPRIYGRLEALVNLLKSDPDSRQAVLTIFDSRQDLGAAVRDVPCTLALQFFVRDEQLCMRVNMRSNDVWLGLPYDIVQFAALQGAVAKALDLPMGWYSHSVGSMHLYATDHDQAEQIKAVDDGIWDYEPLWSGNSIAEISNAARTILYQLPRQQQGPATVFETWLEAQIQDAMYKAVAE